MLHTKARDTAEASKRGEKLIKIKKFLIKILLAIDFYFSVEKSEAYEEPEVISQDKEEENTYEYKESDENGIFVAHELDDQNQNNHDDEYENDSFIIDDNGVTNDHDFTSSSASSLSGEDYQSHDEVSN